MQKFHFIKDNFFSAAPKLRGVFDERFANPREARSDRFVWDYWHVPQQYTLVRTPAYHYFPKAAFDAFTKHLVSWGRENLGCAGISPPWLSYYIEGCGQELHTDVPHGPWAFVYSLSLGRPGQFFKGGETMILRPSVLSYWQNFQDSEDRELNSFVEFIPAKFNRLVVFDPRFPHGVTKVSGTNDPRTARLVIHGWFVEPKPFFVGALTAKQAAGPLDAAVANFQDEMTRLGGAHGTMSVRIHVERTGVVSNIKILTNTVMSVEGELSFYKNLERTLLKSLRAAKFPRAKSHSVITLPLLLR
jgi:hypothetical protein